MGQGILCTTPFELMDFNVYQRSYGRFMGDYPD